MQTNNNSLEVKNLVASYELLNNALTSPSNSKAYHSFKKQMNPVELSVLKVLQQHKTYNIHLANKQNGTIRTQRRTKKSTAKEAELTKEHSSTIEAPSDNHTEATGSQTTEPVAELTAEGIADPIIDATMEAKEESVATPQ